VKEMMEGKAHSGERPLQLREETNAISYGSNQIFRWAV
jgi:hypothetical protein